MRSDLVFSNIRSVNYTVETVDHSVYLIGSARSEAELDHATDLARNVRGVRRVVSYVEIRPGMPPGSAAAGSAAFGRGRARSRCACRGADDPSRGAKAVGRDTG